MIYGDEVDTMGTEQIVEYRSGLGEKDWLKNKNDLANNPVLEICIIDVG